VDLAGGLLQAEEPSGWLDRMVTAAGTAQPAMTRYPASLAYRTFLGPTSYLPSLPSLSLPPPPPQRGHAPALSADDEHLRLRSYTSKQPPACFPDVLPAWPYGSFI